MDRPIPAYYACYLLRSTVRHQALYIGSTPHPIRRLKQHNGEINGGATKTSRDSLRPWEMTCLVSGFPSKIAALQFEWAWQNTHLTRHIAADSRRTKDQTNVRFSPKTGRMRKQRARPSLGLKDRLANLHTLLRANSFRRWPLKVTFYAEDVFRAWIRWTKQHLESLHPDLEVTLDDSSTIVPPGGEATAKNTLRISALDIGYSSYKAVIEKRRELLSADHRISCNICRDTLSASDDFILVCPGRDCSEVFHLDCLATSFVQMNGDQQDLVPLSGRCPQCKTAIQWTELVKDMSLSIRGHKETETMFKKRRIRRPNEVNADDANSGISEEEDQLEDVIPAEDLDEEPWQILSASSEEENAVLSTASRNVVTTSNTPMNIRNDRENVIDDSDWDEAEVLT